MICLRERVLPVVDTSIPTELWAAHSRIDGFRTHHSPHAERDALG
jgi:hypothetical protein